MSLLAAIRQFFGSREGPAHLQDLYAHLPDKKKHSLRARIYENLGKHFRRVGKGLYVAVEGPAVCLVAEGDAWDRIQEIPSGSVNAIITDPAYAWLDKLIYQGTTRPRMRWGYEKSEIDARLGMEMYRVLEEGAHVFIFVPAETGTTKPHIDAMMALLSKCGLKFRKRFIWDKIVLGMGYSGRARYEGILLFSKGKKRKPYDLSIPDVIQARQLPPTQRKHPSEKPESLLQTLIRFSTKINDLILDVFAGSCSTGRAALALGRNCICIEKDPQILARAIAQEVS